MKVMVVDGGGRGQALAVKLAGEGNEVFVSPGNPGNETFAESTGIETIDIQGQSTFAKQNDIEFTVVGNDEPIARGIGDEFREEGLPIFAPTRDQARIEWDRAYAKELSAQLGIPTGHYRKFIDKQSIFSLGFYGCCSSFSSDGMKAHGVRM